MSKLLFDVQDVVGFDLTREGGRSCIRKCFFKQWACQLEDIYRIYIYIPAITCHIKEYGIKIYYRPLALRVLGHMASCGQLLDGGLQKSLHGKGPRFLWDHVVSG